MNTRTCKHCGWVTPVTQLGRKCKICGQPYEVVTCSKCNKQVPIEDIMPGLAMCRKCYNFDAKIIQRGVLQRHTAKLDAMFEDWLNKVRQVPKNYPTLTEDQWLEACTHFNGCARCGDEQIDSRGFFIGASLGGRYCDWNILPLCEKCAVNWDLTKSVFRYTEQRDHILRSDELRDCLDGIIAYLGGKLDAARLYKKDS